MLQEIRFEMILPTKSLYLAMVGVYRSEKELIVLIEVNGSRRGKQSLVTQLETRNVERYEIEAHIPVYFYLVNRSQYDDLWFEMNQKTHTLYKYTFITLPSKQAYGKDHITLPKNTECLFEIELNRCSVGDDDERTVYQSRKKTKVNVDIESLTKDYTSLAVKDEHQNHFPFWVGNEEKSRTGNDDASTLEAIGIKMAPEV